MDKIKNNITSTVITVIISLIAIVTAFSGFISSQSKIETQLANIQTQIAEINVKLDKRDDEIKDLTERITIVETELKND